MSDTENPLNARLIQLNQANREPIDLVKKQKSEFKDFVSDLMSPTRQPSKRTVFAPAYSGRHNGLKSPLSQAFRGVKELYFSGGGGAGCAYPAAVKSACNFGLALPQLDAVCGVSVGAIMALGVALNLDAEELQQVFMSMPKESFQDWSLWNIFTKLSTTWGLCRGQAMPDYFKQLIKEKTGLDDPTFKELYDARFRKELRIITTNVTMGTPDVFSYKTTPDIKVAEMVAISCSVPIFFPVKRIMNKEGWFDIHTDGGVLKNFPWGMGADKVVPNHQRLGLTLINSAANSALSSKKQGNNIATFFEYVYNLFILMLFQQPLPLTEEERRRTVIIRINHNPIDFSPAPAQQKYLDSQSYKAVKELAENIIQVSKAELPKNVVKKNDKKKLC